MYTAFSMLLLVTARLLLWRYFKNPYQHGGFLQNALHYRDKGRLEASYDFYPSWRKHPLDVSEYQGFYRLLGLFLRVTKLPPFRGAQLYQLLLTVLLAWALARIMPEGLSMFAYIAMTVGIAPLFLSLIITPDLMLMTATGLTMLFLTQKASLDPWLLATLLGLLGWAGIRVKSSGLILSISILILLPFTFSHWGYILWALILVISPLALDFYNKRENVILNRIKNQAMCFGYSLEDDKDCIPLYEVQKRTFYRKLIGTLKVLGKGFSSSLNPFHKFSLFHSNGWFYIMGLIGMISALYKHKSGSLPNIIIFLWIYVLLALIFFSFQRRFFHFAGRGGGTFFPLWITGTAYLITYMGELGQIMIWILLILEGLKSFKIIFLSENIVLCERIYPPNHQANPTLKVLKKILKSRDLLFVTYKDLTHFGMVLEAWQVAIELEMASVLTVCKYIEYYTYDKRYRHIYLVLPPSSSVFFDKDKQYHYIEEPEFASRFKQIYIDKDLSGYRIFEAVRPAHYRDLSSLERLSPAQIRNMDIDFGAFKPI